MAKEKLREEEGHIIVTATRFGKKDKEQVKKIKVRPFVTDPARVAVRHGAWFSTGKMRGVKVDVEVNMPCYREEVISTFKKVRNLTDKFMEKEVERLSGNK